MEIVVLIIMLLIGLNYVLKLTYHGVVGIIILCLIPLAFLGFTYELASEQSKMQIGMWLNQPELMLDTSVILTIDVAFQICFCLLMGKSLNGKLSTKERVMLNVTLWFPGLLLFPVLFSMLVEIIFAMPGVEFSVIGWLAGVIVTVLIPIFVYAIKWLLPENDLRLELMFLINLLTAALGIVATVNGRTAAIGTNSVSWDALAGFFAILVIGSLFGLIYNKIRISKKIKYLK